MSISRKEFSNIVEAALFSSETSLSVTQLQLLFPKAQKPSREDLLTVISTLIDDYSDRGVELAETDGSYRFQTRAMYADWLRRLRELRPPRYSRALLETLAIIAYRQPATRGDIEEIRGVTVTTEIMRVLLDREWIRQTGVRSVPGHPGLYETTLSFLGYFGLKSLKELPQLQDPRGIGDIAKDFNLTAEDGLDSLENGGAARLDSVVAATDVPNQELVQPVDTNLTSSKTRTSLMENIKHDELKVIAPSSD